MKKASAASVPREDANTVFARLQNDKTGFTQLAKLLEDLAGICLPINDKNLSLMASRLSRIIVDNGLHTYQEYHDFLSRAPEPAIREFLSCLTTNTTHFFREGKHFEILRETLQSLLEQRLKKHQSTDLRIWCAAASTGQEPYTLAMVAHEVCQAKVPPGSGGLLTGHQYKILATDIDPEVLQKAHLGLYSKPECDGVPADLRARYFEPHTANGFSGYRVKDILKKNIEFAEFNLTASNYPFDEEFDVIFCRNVLIYFSRPTTTAVITQMTQALKPEGYLFLGHSESGAVRAGALKTVAAAVYKKGS